MPVKLVGARISRKSLVPEALEDRRLLSAFVVTNLNDSGPGSLRQAILDANANSGADDITFADGLNGTILLTSGELAIADTMTITASPGQQITIDPNNRSRIFDVASTANATIQNLTMQHGRAFFSQGGGGIMNLGTLTLINDVITQCRAGNGQSPSLGLSGVGGAGGGIASGAPFPPSQPVLTLLHCVVSDNAAGDSEYEAGGGAGGGIFAINSLTIRNSTITGNTAGKGSAGFATAGTPESGWGGGNGGGIDTPSGSSLIVGSTIANNSAGQGGSGSVTLIGPGRGGPGGLGGFGGGIFAASAVIQNSTIANNSAGQGGPGGEGSQEPGGGGPGGSDGGISATTLSLFNDTITQNHAGTGGPPAPEVDTLQGAPGRDGTVGGVGVSSAEIANTIVASNVGGPVLPDLDGVFSSQGHNIIGADWPPSSSPSHWVSSDLVGTADAPVDPRLAPLGDYGGGIPTVALLAGSPALDHGDNALLSPSGQPAITTDQRGFARIFNGTVDIGAYEAQPPPVTGDVNHDGQTNFNDLLALAQSYGQNVPLWEQGDLTGDGQVQFNDLLILAQNYGHAAAPTAAAAPSLAANTLETAGLDSLLTRTSSRASRARTRPAGSSSPRA